MRTDLSVKIILIALALEVFWGAGIAHVVAVFMWIIGLFVWGFEELIELQISRLNDLARKSADSGGESIKHLKDRL